jgi:hypothetical protein
MKIGWNIVIETTNGVVALWTCWLGDNFKLYYPLDVEIPDEMVMKTLGVRYSKPVYDEDAGKRKWAKYYSRKLKEGRVWIEQSDYDMNCNHLGTVEGMNLTEHHCGYDLTNTISTYSFHHASEKQPDAPTTDPKVIKRYRKKFFQLLIEIAKYVGDIKSVTFSSDRSFYSPELLEKEGSKFSRWREDRTNYCYACNDNYEFVLKSGNSLVPWTTYIKFCAGNDLEVEDLCKFMKQVNDKTINMKPIYVVMLKKAI